MTKIQCGNFFIDFSQLKDGMSVDNNNEFLKKYDKDGNSIFSMQEIEQIKQDIEAAAGNDKNLQENEALNLFINKLGISAQEAKSKFATFGNAVVKGLENLNHQKEASIIAQEMWDIIDNNFRMGSLDSKKFNEFWSKVNENNIVYVLEEYKKSKGNKNNESLPISVILETTSSETTKRNLINNMFKMLKANIDTTKYDISSIEKEYRELTEDNNLFYIGNRERLDNLFNTMIQMAKGQTTVGATSTDTTEVVQNRTTEAQMVSARKQGKVSEFLDDVCGAFGGVTKENVQQIIAKQQEIEKELAALENNPKAYAEKFEELFGVKYSPEAVANYKKVNANYKEALILTQRDAAFDDKFAWALKTKDLDYLYTRHGLGAAEAAYERTYKDLCEVFGKDHIDMILQTQCSNMNDCRSKYYVLQQLITEVSNNNKAAIKNHMGNKTIQMMKDERDGAFRAGFGMQNDALLEAEHWSESQQKRLGYTQMGIQILAMAGAMFTGGGTLALLSSAVILSDPIGLVEQMTDPDGMTSEDWKNFMTGRAETLGWMALGLATSGVGAFAGNFVKMKGLASLMQKSGKSLKALLNNPNLPADVAKQIKSIESLAKTMGISTEVALDIVTTAALQKEGATTGDWIASIAGAIAGGSTLGKNLNNSKNVDDAVKQIQNSFPDFKISKEDALKILKKFREKFRKKNKQLNDWAKSPTKSNGNMYSSIVPISPTMLEKAAKFVTRIVTDGIEKLFDKMNAHELTKLKAKNPVAYDAVTDMFTEITTQLCAGRIPSAELLDEVIEKTAKKYAGSVDEHGIDASLLRELFDTYTDGDGWYEIKKYFNKPEASNAKKMDEIEDAMSFFKDTYDLNMPEEAVTKADANTPAPKNETPTKVDAATPKIDETMDIAQLFDAKHLNALSKLDENTYNAVVNIFDSICKEITAGKVPSKEMYDSAISDAVKKFGVDKNTIEKQVKHFMGGSGWDVLSKYLSRPEANNLRNGQIKPEVNDAIKFFKKKRGFIEEQKTAKTSTKVKNPTPVVEEAPTAKAEGTASAKETFEISDELAEKYKYELDQPFYDRESEANLVKIMENYHSLVENALNSMGAKELDYKNIDQVLDFIVSQNGITNYDDIGTAIKLIKERFHKDILADIQRVKNLGNKYKLTDETIRETDDLINEIKNIMASGKKLTKDEIEEMISQIDARAGYATRIEDLIYDNPEIKNYLNDCTHRDVWNNPEITREFQPHIIEEATNILDKIISRVDNGFELTDELIREMLAHTQAGTDELLYKLIEDHHKLGPLYKNMEGNPAINNTWNTKNNYSFSEQDLKTIQNLVDQGIDSKNIEDAINGFKTKSDVPLTPDQITERLSLLADLSKEYPDIPQELIFGLAQNGNIRTQIIMGKVRYNGCKEILDIAKNYPQHQKQLLTLLQNDQYYCRKLSDFEIECGLKYESNNIYQYLKNLENPKFNDIKNLTCFLDALTGLKNWCPNLHNTEKYNQLNTLLHGAEPKEFKQIKDDFKTQTGANLHLDNNIPPEKAKIYMEKAIEAYNTIKARGKNPPENLYLTEWVTEGAGGIFARGNEVNSYTISVKPTENIEFFSHAIIHESTHMLDRNTLRKEIDNYFRFEKVGTDFVVKDGVYYKVIDNQKIERMSGYARRYISNYAGDLKNGSIHELCAELGSMLLEKKIVVENIHDNNGILDFDVKINEPYTNIDGVKIDFTNEMRAELKDLIRYYFSIGGQDFS